MSEECEALCALDESAPVVVPACQEERDAALAALARALSHPVRVAIVRRLRQETACVTEIVGELPLAQSTVSQHLKVLKEAGLICGSVEGPRISYCLQPAALAQMSAWVEAL